ncbi:hypothetical protein GUITHDRAFT_86768 [Guillardia theta CCMP2712]|uniref:Sodium/calcium exchanger membrane region domain-containing protein n=1 Tax=Guillardia theta (strain CCMP2712) TaxID=905079 RepID=L1JD65_GUITC|nr:hypothetical protein GUITHDRAFT_86768 [Guillardia theta CCMP2712]EKX46242.1 hypothetical protein GUITHDRAFT_86768 [Guillardia theta CCMP2712]|eukprot:XP_005833222.1 hypothetical protein GUITHDRAFT_86768 [Guillardia theta CCMP2712]
MENITGPWDGRCKGLILPIFPWEYEWDSNFRAFLYLVGMLWCFIGISVLSDSFMSGIDTITNSTYRKRVARRTPEGEVVFDEQDIPIWNPAVANLTLMALGSSTPEILLALIELLGRDFFSGDLGPGTVLGSASFNLYIITGLCMLVIPENEIRKVKGVSVFLLTSFHSLFAYIWLYIVLVVNTKDVIDLWEAVVTLALMPFLVALVYLADRHASSSQVLPESEDGGANHDPSQLEHDGKQDDAGSAMEVTPQEEEGIEAEGPRLREFNKSRAIEAITHAKQSRYASSPPWSPGRSSSPSNSTRSTRDWSQQFVQALNVNGGDESYDPGLLECVMHFLSIGWKLLAACIPPGRIWGGWACFWVALSMIGLVTALVGDMATVFGCLVGLHDAITAITIVALGTSLPDTFASMIAIRMDSTADNALGNVTGSNSVNVFLGLGLPWWHSLYGSTWDLYEQYSTSGAFVVQSGALGFNVLIFSILTAAAFVIIAIRRLTLGTELGGPRWLSRLCASVFFSLWVIYIVVCSLQVYHPNDFINL